MLKLWSKKTNLEIRLDELERIIASKLGDKMTSNYILSWGLRSTITTAHIHTFLRTTQNESLSQPLQVYLAQLALQETQIEQDIERANFDLGLFKLNTSQIERIQVYWEYQLESVFHYFKETGPTLWIYH